MKMIVRLTLAGLFIAGCAQAATQPQYLTVEQFIQGADHERFEPNKIDPSDQMSQNYFNAISQVIATAPKSAYLKNGKPYSKIDYLCSNQSTIITIFPHQTRYDDIADKICFKDIISWTMPYTK
jgi:hypothetical protein